MRKINSVYKRTRHDTTCSQFEVEVSYEGISGFLQSCAFMVFLILIRGSNNTELLILKATNVNGNSRLVNGQNGEY